MTTYIMRMATFTRGENAQVSCSNFKRLVTSSIIKAQNGFAKNGHHFGSICPSLICKLVYINIYTYKTKEVQLNTFTYIFD